MKNSNQQRLILIERVLLLKEVSIFSETPESILGEIAHLMEEQTVDPNINIVTEGEIGNCMYIIFQGQVRVHKGNQTLAILKEKNYFGELSLLDTETRSATVTSQSECILYKINQEPFFDLIDFRPEVLKAVMQNLSKRLRDANYKIFELSKKTT
ncbi:MAG: cyclic nucleotide-binding domain-containing protein [Chitinophagaceae bacterium]|nr:cyclic nucleotide-binding domain-containing protein [Chitinophagaceae bacterium]